MFETLFSPKQIGTVTVKNRLVFAPTTWGLSQEEMLLRYRAIAKGGCGMVAVGDVPARQTPTAPSLQKKKGFAFYTQVAEVIHEGNALASAQLFDSDGNWKALLPLLPAVLCKKKTPDDLRQALNDSVGPYITSLSAKKVKEITTAYGKAAKKAKEAGFDLIQIHGDRMCGAFLSTLFNNRSDRYGGSLAHRLTFALEAVAAAKTAGLPVEMKFVVRTETYGKAGLLAEEVAEAVRLLEMAGVDSFHVTLANHSALTHTIPPKTHPAFGAEGCFLPFASLVKQAATVPVCTVGAWQHPQQMEECCKKGEADFFAMSRQLICDAAWCEKVRTGQLDQIKYCVRCNRCVDSLMQHKGTRCIFEKGAKEA